MQITDSPKFIRPSFRNKTVQSPKNPYLFQDLSHTKYNRSPSKSRLTTQVSEENNSNLVSEIKRFLEAPTKKPKKPFILIDEADLIKKDLRPNPYHYKPILTRDYAKDNKSFENDFSQYLDGKISISQLISLNNFPHEKNTTFSLDPKHRENININHSFKPKNKNIQQAFSELRGIVKDRIVERKKRKDSNIRNIQLFKYFENISEDYMQKIANSDLESENFKKKYYLRESTIEKNMENFLIIREKPMDISILIIFTNFIIKFYFDEFLKVKKKLNKNGIRQMKEDNKVGDNILRHRMKQEVDFFLSNLSKSRELENQMKMKLLHKSLERSIKSSKYVPENLSDKKVIKRKIFSNYDIALYEYLLHSRLIKDFKDTKKKDMHLRDVFNNEDKEIIAKRRNTINNATNLEDLENDEYQMLTKKAWFNNTIQSPHIILSNLKENSRRNSVIKINKTAQPKKMKKMHVYYYKIKRNANELDLSDQTDRNGDDSLISNTEVTLDQMYQKSIELQKKLVQNPNEHFSKRFKEIMKLDELNDKILKANKKKLE